MIAVTASVAIAAASLFAGAALVISVAEQPSRLRLAPDAMLAEWRDSYARAAPMQAGLVVLGTVAAVATWWLGGDQGWLVGAAVLLLNLPWTLVGMRSVNGALHRIESPGPAPALVARWGRLHAVRTILGLVAAFVFLVQRA